MDILGVLQPLWPELLLALLVFVTASAGGIAVVSILLVRLPATYFLQSRPREFWTDAHPALRWTGLIIRNIIGGLVVAVGVVLAMPGVPGPGILTILLGIMLMNFPGKRRLERWLISQPKILENVNRLRRRYGKPPLVLDEIVVALQEAARPSEIHSDIQERLQVAGTMRIQAVEDQLGLDVKQEDVETVGGLVLSLLERPPKKGDVVMSNGLRIEVTAIEGHGVKTCLIMREERAIDSTEMSE